MNGYITKPVRAATLEEEVLKHARRVRILAVDDAPEARLLIRLWLERAGAEVEVAADGASALAAMRGRSYDLILLDHELPDLDGPHLALALREAGHGGPFGLVTGHADPARRPGWEALASAVLVKPITGEALTELVSGILSGTTGDISPSSPIDPAL